MARKARKKGHRAKKEADKNRLRKKLESDETKKKYNDDSLKRMKKKLDSPNFKKSQSKNTAEWKKKNKNLGINFREEEYEKTKETYSRDAESRIKRLQQNSESLKRKVQSNPEYSTRRQEQKTEGKRDKYNNDESFKAKTLVSNTESLQQKKDSNPIYKDDRNKQSARIMKESRLEKRNEKEQKKQEKVDKKREEKLQKLNDQYTFRESHLAHLNDVIKNYKHKDKKKQAKVRAEAKLERDFINEIRQVAGYICCCCEVLCFANNIDKFDLKTYFDLYNLKAKKPPKPKDPVPDADPTLTTDPLANPILDADPTPTTDPLANPTPKAKNKKKKKESKFYSHRFETIEDFKKNVVGFESGWICKTCSKNLKQKGRLPLINPQCGVRHPIHIDRPEVLRKLSALEELLVAPLHAFTQLVARTKFQVQPQIWIKGSVINIVPDTTQLISTLPAKFDETSTIQLDFKRRLDHKSSYLFETITVKNVLDALHYLLNTPLYARYNIKFDKKAFSEYDPEAKADLINFIVPNEFEKIHKKDYIPEKVNLEENSKEKEKETIQVNESSEVNEPIQDEGKSIIECDEKIDFTILPDDISIMNEKNELYNYKFMSPFNSVFHGISGSCKIDDDFKDYVTKSSCPLFNFVSQAFEKNENLERDWIKFICEKIPEFAPQFQSSTGIHQNCREILDRIDSALFPLLDKSFTSFAAHKCCETCVFGRSKRISSALIYFSNINPCFNTHFRSYMKAFENNLVRNCDELYKCTKCNESIEFGTVETEYRDFVLINVLEPENIDGKRSLYSDLYEDIPSKITLNGNLYEMKFVISKEGKYFNTYIKRDDHFIEINSQTQKEKIIKNTKFKVNPAFIAYFKKPNFFPSIDQIDSDFELGEYQILQSLEQMEKDIDNLVLPEEIENHLKEIERNIEEQLEIDKENLEKNEHVLLLSDYNFKGIQEYAANAHSSSSIFKDVLIVAPGQGKKPVYASQFEDYDALCWPKSYCGHPQTYDRENISYTRVIRNEIGHWDRTRFTAQQILFKAKEKIKRDLGSCIQTALRKCKTGSLTKEDVSDPERLKDLISKNVAYQILPQIRTSNEYLKSKELQARRMLRQFGLCNIFFTTGLSETHSPELLKQMYRNIFHKDISLIEGLHLDSETKNKLIKEDPLSCAEMFHHRMQALEKFMKKPGGLFGDNYVTHFMKRSECQMRGSLHSHQVLWLHDAPTLKAYEIDSGIRKVNEDQVTEFADKHISTKYIKDHPNMQFQIHHHTATCFKNGNNECRFHFPRFVAHETKILYPWKNKQDRTKKRLADLEKIKAKMNEYKDTRQLQPFEDMLKELNMTEIEYYEALKCSISKISIFYERESDAVMINNYSRTLLDTYEGNHDIQVILDAYAAIHYLFKYCLKVDEGVNHLMEKAVEECREGNLSIKETFRRVANVFHNASYLSAQQAVQEIKGYPVVKFSESEKFINTNMPEDRTSLLKPQAEIDELEKLSKDIFIKGLLDEYASRPANMEHVSLADFAAWYDRTKKGPKKKGFNVDQDEESSGDDEDETPQEDVKVTSNIHQYRIRHSPRVIRFVNYKLNKDEANYYREMVMLYFPWRNEEKQLLNLAEVKETFQQNYKQIMEKYREYNVISEDELEKLKVKVLEHLKEERNEEIDNFLNEGNEEIPEIDVYEELAIDPEDRPKEKNVRKRTEIGLKVEKKGYSLKEPALVDRKNLHANIRSMNKLQQEITMHLNHLIRTKDEFDSENAFIIIQGKAGVGKTFVINVVKDLVNDFYNRRAGADFKSNKVLLLAPTGVSAYLIKGNTIHSALSINMRRQNRYSDTVEELSANLLNTIKREMRDIKVIIADEYSMISRQMRLYMDQRFQEIYGKVGTAYAGKIMIFAGDLFQLKPVGNYPIYSKGKKPTFDDLNKDDQWKDFRMFELTDPVRQKDPKFIKCLNEIGMGRLSKESAKYLRARVVKTKEEVPKDALWLFYKNVDVDEFNDNYIQNAPGETFESIATDDIHLPESAIRERDQLFKDGRENLLNELSGHYCNDSATSTRWRYRLPLKENIRYKMVSNISVQEGLVNGALCVLRKIDFDRKTKKPKILWMEFLDKKAGAALRQQNMEYMKKEKIPAHLVPISLRNEIITETNDNRRTALNIKVNHQVIRRQFPVTPCQASTIHTTQGLTVPCVCVDSKGKNLETDLAYVAFSRCDYEGLYIMNDIPIPTERQPHLIGEINRLKHTAKLRLSYYNFDQDLGVKIAYHNVNSYNAHKDDVTAVHWYWNADIIVLSETGIQSSDEVEVREGFKVIFPSVVGKKKKIKSSEGLIIMCKESCDIQNLSEPNVICQPHHIDLRSFEVDNHFIITGYRHPKAPLAKFLDEVIRLVNKAPEGYEVVLLGDMNIDMNSAKNQNNLFFKFLKKNNFYNYLGSSKTNDCGSQIDIVFSTSSLGYGGTFASYFSDHFAIFYQTKINPLKLPETERKFLEALKQEKRMHEDDDEKIHYEVIKPQDIKSGMHHNLPFGNEITAKVEIEEGNYQMMKFTNLNAYNTIFAALYALCNYTQVFQSVVEEHYMNLPLFDFIIEIRENFHNLGYSKNEKWINFLIGNFPDIIEYSEQEIDCGVKNMSVDISLAIQKLLRNWRENKKEISNEWCSLERKLTICNIENCKEVIEPLQEVMININFSQNHFIKNLNSIIESTIYSDTLECPKCKNNLKLSPLDYFSNRAMFINLRYENAVLTKNDIAEIPRTIVLNKIIYALKIVIENINGQFKIFYRVENGNFLEIDDKQGLEILLVKHKEEISIAMLMYVKSDHEEVNEALEDASTNYLDELFDGLNEEQIDEWLKDDDEEKIISFVESLNKNEDKISSVNFETALVEDSSSFSSAFNSLKIKNSELKTEEPKTNFQEINNGVHRNVPFENQFSAMGYWFKAMCPFNSMFSAFSSLLNFTDFFKSKINELTSTFEFFKLIFEIRNNFYDIHYNRNQKWIDFINRAFPGIMQQNLDNGKKRITFNENLQRLECEMTWDVGNVIECENGGFFRGWESSPAKKYFVVHAEKVRCLNVKCGGVSVRELFMPFLTIEKESLLENKKLESEIMDLLKQGGLFCENCNEVITKKPTFKFSECLILRVSLMYDENGSPVTVDINKITKNLTLDNNNYVLKTIIDHPGNHFKSFYRIEGAKFLEMDDITSPTSYERILNHPLPIGSTPNEINPVILIYVKSNEIIIEEMYKTIDDSGIRAIKSDQSSLMDFFTDDQPLDMSYSSIEDDELNTYSDFIDLAVESDGSEKITSPKIIEIPGTPKHAAKKRKTEESHKSIAKTGEISLSDFNLTLKNAAIMDNTITLQSEKKTYNFLCPYNSILHGFIKSINLDLNFLNFINSNRKKFHYFDIILQLFNTRARVKRNELWIKFLHETFDEIDLPINRLANYPFKPSGRNTYAMTFSTCSAYEYILPNFLSYEFTYECEICGHTYKKETNLIYFLCRQKSIATFLNDLNSTVIKIYKPRKCLTCKKNYVLKQNNYSDMIVVYPGFSEGLNVPLNTIPTTIMVKEDPYVLKFFVHFEKYEGPDAINHFVSYAYDAYEKSTKNYFVVDDATKTDRRIDSRNVLVHPELLFYFKTK